MPKSNLKYKIVKVKLPDLSLVKTGDFILLGYKNFGQVSKKTKSTVSIRTNKYYTSCKELAGNLGFNYSLTFPLKDEELAIFLTKGNIIIEDIISELPDSYEFPFPRISSYDVSMTSKGNLKVGCATITSSMIARIYKESQKRLHPK